MSDQACKSEEQHRIDTLQEMANTEHQLRMARTQYEAAKGELVRASEALLEWQEQWNKERRAVFACYPDAMPVDNVVEDARATMDRFLAQSPAALTPTPDFIAEQETAREQLEREPDHVPTMRADWEDEPNDFEDFEDDDTPTEHISILTGDPAIEPESGLHEERPALNEAMQDEREEPVALAQPEWNEPDGYAPVTNPEADTIARAHDYYSPEKMGDRNRSVFDIFRHKREDA